MAIDIGTFMTNLSGAGLAGVISGYAAKKVVKIFLVIVGIQFAVFAYLENQGILDVNWSVLQSSITGGNTTGNSSAAATDTVAQQSTQLASSLPIGMFGASFALGFSLGFYKA